MTPRDTRDEAKLRELACAIIDAIPGLMGMTPDPWPQEPAASCPHSQDVVDGVVALLRAPETQDGPSRDFLLAENARLKAALKARETQERGWQDISTAPKDDGQDVIVADAGGLVGHGFFDRANQVWRWLDDDPIVNPMHWQLMPSPPAQTEDR